MSSAGALGPTPPHGFEEIVRFYEWDPARYLTPAGRLVPAGPTTLWQREAMALFKLPAPFTLSWAGGQTTRRMTCHRKLVPVYEAAFAAILVQGLWGFLDPFGGSFAWRAQRGSGGTAATHPSMHAFGAATDHDPGANPRGRAPEATKIGGTLQGRQLVSLMASFGFTWGGHFPVPDAMHFQWGSGY